MQLECGNIHGILTGDLKGWSFLRWFRKLRISFRGDEEKACRLHDTDGKHSWLQEQFESGIFV